MTYIETYSKRRNLVLKGKHVQAKVSTETQAHCFTLVYAHCFEYPAAEHY